MSNNSARLQSNQRPELSAAGDRLLDSLHFSDSSPRADLERMLTETQYGSVDPNAFEPISDEGFDQTTTATAEQFTDRFGELNIGESSAAGTLFDQRRPIESTVQEQFAQSGTYSPFSTTETKPNAPSAPVATRPDNSKAPEPTNPLARAMRQVSSSESKSLTPNFAPDHTSQQFGSTESAATETGAGLSEPQTPTQAQINETQKTASEASTAEKLKALREQFQQAEAQRPTLTRIREQQASAEVDSINSQLKSQLPRLMKINASFAAEVLRSMADGVVKSVYGKVSQSKLLKHVGDANSSHTALQLHMERQERKAKLQNQAGGGTESGPKSANKTAEIHWKQENLDSNVNNGA